MSGSAFETAGLWDQYGRTEDYAERLEIILRLIPEDVTSVLDVGCGKGEILNAIRETRPHVKLLGVDVASEPLRAVAAPVEVAALPDIPVADRAFDTVLCLQVLEHIAESSYRGALAELERLANRYIIVGVPFEENLGAKEVVCGRCERISHVDGHLRRFRREDLRHLLAGFKLDEVTLAGVVQKRQPRLATWLQHAIASQYHRPSPGIFVCPYCNSTETRASTSGRSRVTRRLVRLANRALGKFSVPKAYWMIAVFRRCP